ncbi:MAG: N-acetylmuramoyl-L-alanine amidase [Nitrospirota bacterium]
MLYKTKKRFLIIPLIWIFVFLIIPQTSISSSPWKEFKEAKQKYKNFLLSETPKSKKENWITHKKRFKRIIKKYPKSPIAGDAIYILGELHTELFVRFKEQKDIDKSLQYYFLLINKYPQNSHIDEAHYRIAQIYTIYKKDYKRAFNEYKRLIELYPKSDFARESKERMIELDEKGAKAFLYKTNIIKEIRYTTSKTYTRVVIESDKPVNFSEHRISNPERLYFDIKDATLDSKIKREPIILNDGILRQIRLNQFTANTVRIVLDLGRFESYKVFLLENPERIVIDVVGIETKPIKKPPADIQTAIQIKRIVIDPGHGGKDPGAIGPNGLMEKDVVLDIAKRLQSLLKKNKDLEVFLTRKSDIYIPLDKRTAIANSKEADIFISIHTNASPNFKTKGVETYLLNWTNDKEAMSVAARENAISKKRMKEIRGELEWMLSDLIRDNKRDESIRLANMTQESLIKNLSNRYSGITALGVKQALFYVLIGARMPSILVEVSFITNPLEEKRLSDKTFRQRIAGGLYGGVERYINSVKTRHMVKRNEKDGS